MDIQKLQSLIDGYLDAQLTSGQETELRQMVRDADLEHLPPMLQIDVKMVRTLLGASEYYPAPKADYRKQLASHIDSVTTGPALHRPRHRFLIPTVIAAAAASLLLLTIGKSSLEHASGSPSDSGSMPKSSLAIAAPAKVSPSDPATLRQAEASSKPARANIHHKRNRKVEISSQAPQNAEAQIIMRTAEGEVLTADNFENMPQALALLEQAFDLFSYSGQEASQSLSDSNDIVTTAINKIESDLDE